MDEISKLKYFNEVAEHIVKGGMAKSGNNKSSLVTIMLAGDEIGITPIASVRNISNIKGNLSYSANLIAQLIDESKIYRYRIVEHNKEICSILFQEKNESDKWVDLGISEFTFAQAKAINLTRNPIWKSYTKALLFARAISQGFRWYSPSLGRGAILYTDEEMETASILDSQKKKTTKTTKEKKEKTSTKPFWVDADLTSPESVKSWSKTMLDMSDQEIEDLYNSTEPDSEGKVGLNFVENVTEIWEAM